MKKLVSLIKDNTSIADNLYISGLVQHGASAIPDVHFVLMKSFVRDNVEVMETNRTCDEV